MNVQAITVETRRTRKTVTVPIHPQFGAWLEGQTRGIGKAPVFPSLAGKSGSGKSGLSMAFKRIMDTAGIKGRLLREATGAGRAHSSLSYHSLRHSFNAALANAGVGVELRKEVIGHFIAGNESHSHASRYRRETAGCLEVTSDTTEENEGAMNGVGRYRSRNKKRKKQKPRGDKLLRLSADEMIRRCLARRQKLRQRNIPRREYARAKINVALICKSDAQ